VDVAVAEIKPTSLLPHLKSVAALPRENWVFSCSSLLQPEKLLNGWAKWFAYRKCLRERSALCWCVTV